MSQYKTLNYIFTSMLLRGSLTESDALKNERLSVPIPNWYIFSLNDENILSMAQLFVTVNISGRLRIYGTRVTD